EASVVSVKPRETAAGVSVSAARATPHWSAIIITEATEKPASQGRVFIQAPPRRETPSAQGFLGARPWPIVATARGKVGGPGEFSCGRRVRRTQRLATRPRVRQ